MVTGEESVCPECGGAFKQPSRLRSPRQRFCSQYCARRATCRGNTGARRKEKRVLDHACPAPPSDCILWEKGTTANGYGQITLNGKIQYAHHAVLWQELGIAVPPGKVVMHTCDTPSCVQVRHLKIATQAENNADREAKGRGVRVCTVPAATVLEIRKHIGDAPGWHTRIARELGVSRRHVDRIANGTRRGDVA